VVEEAEEAEETVAEEVIDEGEIFVPPPMVLEGANGEGKSQIRFAEDIMPGRRGRSSTRAGKTKTKKKKKGGYTKDTSEDGVKARKGTRDFTVEEEEEF